MAKRRPEEDATSPEARHDTQCAWNDHGYRCGQPGAISDATDGTGAWYCRAHEAKRLSRRVPRETSRPAIEGYGISARQEGETSAEYQKRAMEFLRSRIGMIGKATPSRAWAHSILDRFADRDETVSDVAFRMACEAIGADPEMVRQERDSGAPAAVDFVEFK